MLGQWLGQLAHQPWPVQSSMLEKSLPSSLPRRQASESEAQTSYGRNKAQTSDLPPPWQLVHWGRVQPCDLPPRPSNTLTNIAQVPPIAWQTEASETLLLLQARPTIVAGAGDTVT